MPKLSVSRCLPRAAHARVPVPFSPPALDALRRMIAAPRLSAACAGLYRRRAPAAMAQASPGPQPRGATSTATPPPPPAETATPFHLPGETVVAPSPQPTADRDADAPRPRRLRPRRPRRRPRTSTPDATPSATPCADATRTATPGQTGKTGKRRNGGQDRQGQIAPQGVAGVGEACKGRRARRLGRPQASTSTTAPECEILKPEEGRPRSTRTVTRPATPPRDRPGRRHPDPGEPDLLARDPGPGPDRRAELLHRQVPDPALPAPDLPGRRHRSTASAGRSWPRSTRSRPTTAAT